MQSATQGSCVPFGHSVSAGVQPIFSARVQSSLVEPHLKLLRWSDILASSGNPCRMSPTEQLATKPNKSVHDEATHRARPFFCFRYRSFFGCSFEVLDSMIVGRASSTFTCPQACIFSAQEEAKQLGRKPTAIPTIAG